MNSRLRRCGYQCVFAFAAAAFLVIQARAQSIQSVRFYTLKPDRVADFLAATKEAAALQKSAGSMRYYSVLHSLSGHNEYVRADSYTKWADLDAAADPKITQEQRLLISALTTRINQCVESSHRIIDEEIPDLSLPQTGTFQMIRVLQTRVRPEKVGEYMGLVKGEVLPAAKKAGLKFYTTSQVRYGGSNTAFVLISSLNNWAELDGGLWIQKTMGEEGYQRFLAKLRPLTVESEANVYRLIPDSSYLPPMK
jgi:hypothetical protein